MKTEETAEYQATAKPHLHDTTNTLEIHLLWTETSVPLL